MLPCSLAIASFSGPAQLYVACSTENCNRKGHGPGNKASLARTGHLAWLVPEPCATLASFPGSPTSTVSNENNAGQLPGKEASATPLWTLISRVKDIYRIAGYFRGCKFL